ncbi:MAG TPA: tyrosine-type recombinase/integrase [Acidobacteriota bacterium]|nr:tyrosine-type recombinase/integrase [Acidobacteriota bacterium]
MKLIELPKSPYWGAYIHVGYKPNGHKRFRMASSKVRRDESAIDPFTGRRMDKDRAVKVLTAMQMAALEAIEVKRAGNKVLRADFERMLETILAAVGVEVEDDGPTWSEFVAQWYERQSKDLSDSSKDVYKQVIGLFESWIDQNERLKKSSPLNAFRPSDLQAWYDWQLEGGRVPSTANRNMTVLSSIFEAAFNLEYCKRNPCKGVSRKEAVKISKVPFTTGEIGRMVAVCRRGQVDHAEEWLLSILFASVTGARLSDCVSLRWENFSDDFRRVTFVPKKKRRQFEQGKEGVAISVCLPSFVADAFRAAFSIGNEYATPELLRLYAEGRISAEFHKVMDAAGIMVTVKRAGNGVGQSVLSHGFHSFRGTLKTELRADGVPLETSNYVTGHDDEKVARKYVSEKAETIYRECERTFNRIEDAISQAVVNG